MYMTIPFAHIQPYTAKLIRCSMDSVWKDNDAKHNATQDLLKAKMGYCSVMLMST